MRRRALLRAAALAGVAGIAGCTDDGPSDAPDGGGADGDDGEPSPTASPTDTPTDSPTNSPTDSETPTGTPAGNDLVSQSFEVTAQGCGEGQNTVDIQFDGSQVTLGGVIDGSNGCYTAEQDTLEYDRENDRLRVNVRAHEREDAEMCTQCIVDIEYEARYEFENGAPSEVTVAHDGRDIASGGHGSASAGGPQ